MKKRRRKRNEKMCSEVHKGATGRRRQGEKEMRKCVVKYTKEQLDEEEKDKR